MFDIKEAYNDIPVMINCGRCIGCRLEKSRQWALRSVLESKMHDENCFLTLTYRPESLKEPQDYSLKKEHLQRFFKELRRNQDKKIRYFACGEYGEKLNRPHFHVCLFGYDPPDKVFYKQTSQGHNLYISEFLEKIWSFGFVVVGELTFESVAYTARYITKKITGDKAESHYQAIYEETGELIELEPEFCLMSRRPGIGKEFYTKYKGDCYPKDSITVRGVKMKPPSYFDKLYEEEEPDHHRELSIKRKKAFYSRLEEQHSKRLMDKEIVKKAQISTLKRGIEKC